MRCVIISRTMATALGAFQRADSLTQMQLKAEDERNKRAGQMAMYDGIRERPGVEGMGEIQQPAPVLYNGGEKFAMEDMILGESKRRDDGS